MEVISSDQTLGGRAPSPLAVPRRLLRLRSDAALIERFRLGDETAFDVLYERLRPGVLAVCMGVLGTAHDSEDATQETFASFALAVGAGTSVREPRAWLSRVARNAAIDVARRRRGRALTMDGEVPEVPVAIGGVPPEFAVVMSGIRELPENQRTALLMRELGGHSYREIGSLLECDEEAVRGLVARARVGLRTYRAASELSCSDARLAIETEPDARLQNKTIRRHVKGCAPCRGYQAALRDDAAAVRAIVPLSAGGLAGGGAWAGGGFAAVKAALFGTGVGASVGATQLGAACAVSVCAVGAAGAVGSFVLIAPAHRPPPRTSTATHAVLRAAPTSHRVAAPGSAPTRAVHAQLGPTGVSTLLRSPQPASSGHPLVSLISSEARSSTTTRHQVTTQPPAGAVGAGFAGSPPEVSSATTPASSGPGAAPGAAPGRGFGTFGQAPGSAAGDHRGRISSGSRSIPRRARPLRRAAGSRRTPPAA